MRTKFPLALLLAVAALASTLAVAVAAGTRAGDKAVEYPAKDNTYVGVRPTAVGLPQIGISGTVGGGELPASLRSYHDSGRYDADVKTLVGSAQTYLAKRLKERAKPPRACTVSYKRIRGQSSYRRVRKCKAVKQPAGKPAIVLDIDETSLSNYTGLEASNFAASGSVGQIVAGTGDPIAPTVALAKFAKDNGVAVFFVTGRPDAVKGPTEQNLENAGYEDPNVTYKPGDTTTADYKSGERARIESEGFYIYANVGDQESDLDGGHAERGFKVPNPFYFIAD